MYSFGKIGGLWLGSSSTFKAQDRPRIDILGLDPSTIDKKKLSFVISYQIHTYMTKISDFLDVKVGIAYLLMF